MRVYNWKTGKYTKINNVSFWAVGLLFFILFCAFQLSYKEQITFSVGGMDFPRSDTTFYIVSPVVQLSESHE